MLGAPYTHAEWCGHSILCQDDRGIANQSVRWDHVRLLFLSSCDTHVSQARPLSFYQYDTICAMVNFMADYTRKKIKVVYRDPAELIPYSKNARTHDSEIEFLCNTIRENGFDAGHAIVVDKNDVIICGHGRRLAAMKLGMKEVPVVKREDLSDKQVKAYRLADNKVADLSGWDFDMLDEELAFLKDMDMDMTQFGFEDFSQFEPPEVQDEPMEGSEDDDTLIVTEPPSKGGDDLMTSYRVVVECSDARDQKELYEELSNRGFYCQMML